MSHNSKHEAAKPVTVDYIALPVIGENWGKAMFQVAHRRFKNIAEMNDPKSLRVSLLTNYEQGRLAKLSEKDGDRIRDGLHDIKADGARKEITLHTADVDIKNGRIIVNLVEDDRLTQNRHAVVDLVNTVMRTSVTFHPVVFSVDLGALENNDHRESVIDGLIHSPVPESVTLGQNVLGLTIDRIGHIEY